MEPIVYRVIEATPNDKGISLLLSQDGIEDPEADIVLVWRDDQDVEWAHWKEQDYGVDTLSWRFPLDLSDDETHVLVGNNKPWSNNNATAEI
jgi:hypothetical protein